MATCPICKTLLIDSGCVNGHTRAQMTAYQVEQRAIQAALRVVGSPEETFSEAAQDLIRAQIATVTRELNELADAQAALEARVRLKSEVLSVLRLARDTFRDPE